MRHKAIKYIIDIQNTIREIEEIKAKANNNYDIFSKDIIFQRAIERDLEIIGEAIKKLLEIDASIPISSVKQIIGLRNIIAHAYDAVDIALLWSIIQKDN